MLKIGIAIPCHKRDEKYLPYCLQSVYNLNPKSYKLDVKINEGLPSMQQILTDLYDGLFKKGCDVILRTDVDFLLFPHILKGVDANRVTTFLPLNRKLYDIIFYLHKLSPLKTWSGCYSIPKDLWTNKIKQRFDGTETSVRKSAGKWKTGGFAYYALRPYVHKHTVEMLKTFSLPKRIVWQLIRFKAVRMDAN